MLNVELEKSLNIHNSTFNIFFDEPKPKTPEENMQDTISKMGIDLIPENKKIVKSCVYEHMNNTITVSTKKIILSSDTFLFISQNIKDEVSIAIKKIYVEKGEDNVSKNISICNKNLIITTEYENNNGLASGFEQIFSPKNGFTGYFACKYSYR